MVDGMRRQNVTRWLLDVMFCPGVLVIVSACETPDNCEQNAR